MGFPFEFLTGITLVWSGMRYLPGFMLPARPNFVSWHLIFVGPRCETRFIWPFWGLEFCVGSQIFLKHFVRLIIDISWHMNYLTRVTELFIHSVQGIGINFLA
jgi:hypothetical protein